MQEMPPKASSALAGSGEPAIDDRHVALVAQEIAGVIGECLSSGQVKVLLPSICQAILRGSEKYAEWRHLEDLKMFTNRRKLDARKDHHQ